MNVELVNGAAQVVARGSLGNMLQVPATDEPLTACVDHGGVLELAQLAPGPARWIGFAMDASQWPVAQ